MSVSVKYNGLQFPDPQPFCAISDTPININGRVDHISVSIDLIGTITGLTLGDLERQKNTLTTGLSTAFKLLEIGSGQYTLAQPTSLSFQDSDLTTVLPYTASFSCYKNLFNNSSTTAYSGISSPRDSWTFEEDGNKIVRAVHSVSAEGKKISETESNLDLAVKFVTGRIQNHLGVSSNPMFENFSVFLSGQTGYLISRTEEIDRFGGKYGITDTFLISTALEDVCPSGILNTETSINWTRDGGLTVSLNGTLQGGMTGYTKHRAVHSGMFTPNDAKFFASKALERSKSTFESGAYGSVFQKPRSYDYTVDEDANVLTFSFDFADPSDPRTTEVLHEYTANIDASKDTNLIKVTVEGSFKYNGVEKIFLTGAPETGARFAAVSGEFKKLNTFALASKAYSGWATVVSAYDNPRALNLYPEASSVTKSPFLSEISYSDTFNNSIDYSTGGLYNPTFQITRNHSVNTCNVKPNIENSFCLQSGYATVPSVQISARTDILSGASLNNSLIFFSGLVKDYLIQYSFDGTGIVISDTCQTTDDTISIDKTLIYTI